MNARRACRVWTSANQRESSERTTVGSLQSGLYYGYLGLVDGILERLLDEMGKKSMSWLPEAWRG